MIKLVDPSGFNFDQPIMSLIDVHSRGIDSGWLKKSAAVLTKELSDIRPESGKTFMHLIALGDSETYGANRNGDLFPKCANEKYHDTFVKYANFYRHHKNKPKLGHRVYGHVKASAYNPEMHRVELIISIDNQAAPDTIEKVASGSDIPVSMAASVPFDECTICHNKARTVKDYCNCITKHATQVLADGRQVGMINWEPKFFDISEVARNADRIAFSLRKVASVTSPVLSASVAEAMGITAPVDLLDANMQKKAEFLGYLATLERELTQHNKYAAYLTRSITLPKVAEQDVRPVFNLLKQARVLLPIEDFYKLVLGDRFSEVEHDLPMAKAAMYTVYREADCQPESFLSGLNNYEPLDKSLPNGIKQMIKAAIAKSSLTDDDINRCVVRHVLTEKCASVVPYKPAEVTDAGKYLAQEYAKYKFAFLENENPSVIRLSMLQNC